MPQVCRFRSGTVKSKQLTQREWLAADDKLDRSLDKCATRIKKSHRHMLAHCATNEPVTKSTFANFASPSSDPNQGGHARTSKTVVSIGAGFRRSPAASAGLSNDALSPEGAWCPPAVARYAPNLEPPSASLSFKIPLDFSRAGERLA